MTLATLRRETRPLHDRLERNEHLAMLLADDLTVDAYRALLQRLYGYYAPLEHRLEAYAAGLPVAMAARRKTPLLSRDLRALGCSTQDLARIERCRALPAVDGSVQATGCLYVLEGATLGGRIIQRHLHRSLALTPASGGAFYAGYEAQTGAMWRTFCQAVDDADPSAAETDAMVAAAQATFLSLDRWLSNV